METSKITFIFITVISGLLVSCNVVPVNSLFEDASMNGKKNVDAMAHYSSYSISADGASEKINTNFGGRLGYGVSDRVDLKFRYVNLAPSTDEDVSNVDYFSLTAKYSMNPDKLAGTFGVGLYSDGFSTTWALKPKFIGTGTISPNFKITGATGLDFFFGDGGNDFAWSANLGLAISGDLSKWAIRPEIGIMKDIDAFSSGSYLMWGIGTNYNFKK